MASVASQKTLNNRATPTIPVLPRKDGMVDCKVITGTLHDERQFQGCPSQREGSDGDARQEVSRHGLVFR